jgi:hypothetical protein
VQAADAGHGKADEDKGRGTVFDTIDISPTLGLRSTARSHSQSRRYCIESLRIWSANVRHYRLDRYRPWSADWGR